MRVGVGVLVGVLVFVGVEVFVGVDVRVAVRVGVWVGVAVRVGVGVSVKVGVALGAVSVAICWLTSVAQADGRYSSVISVKARQSASASSSRPSSSRA